MKLGITHCNVGRLAHPEPAAVLALQAEAAGIESLWTVDHIAFPDHIVTRYPETPDGKLPFPPDTALAEPLIWMSHVAAHTVKVKLGTAVVVAPQRETLLLAKQLASLDVITKGRLIAGFGVGWMREEFEAVGAAFHRRGAILDEQITALRGVWEGSAVASGPLVRFERVHSHPRPTGGTVPIHIGGYSEVAARRAGNVGDGYFPGGYELNDRLTELIAVARHHSIASGRCGPGLDVTARWTKDPEALGDRVFVERAAAIGIDRLVVPASLFEGPHGPERLAQAVETVRTI